MDFFFWRDGECYSTDDNTIGFCIAGLGDAAGPAGQRGGVHQAAQGLITASGLQGEQPLANGTM